MCNQTANHPRRGRHSHQHPFKKHLRNKMRANMNMPPVNVEEFDDRFELNVFAAGYSKSDFDVRLENETLIILAKGSENPEAESENWRRKEFHARGFERHFIVNEKVDKDAINAKYKDGILKVTLPKLAGFETTRSEVEIN